MVSHSIWLVPDEPALSIFQAEVNRNSKILGHPTYLPHITVVADIRANAPILESVLRTEVLSIGRFEFSATGIETSSAYFRSLYLSLSETPRLALLRQSILRSLTGYARGQCHPPHISLAYGSSGSSNVAELRERFSEMLPMIVTCSDICLVRSAHDIPIEDWKIVSKIALHL